MSCAPKAVFKFASLVKIRQATFQEEFGCSRDQFAVATKVTGPSAQMTWIRGGPTSLSKKDIAEAIDGSLRRLQTDYIDIYQLHWPDRLA